MLTEKHVIIFDMDGVLFDSEPLHCQYEDSLFRKMNINASTDQKKQFVGLGDLKFWTLLKELFNLDEPLEELLKYDSKERINFFKHHNTPVMAGSGTLLENLHSSGFRMALASSSLTEIIDMNLLRSGYSRYFEIRVSNGMVKKGKPDPDIFLYAASLMNTEPSNCVVIEDSEHGIKAALSAGMRCIALKNDPDSIQDVSSADMIVRNLSEITREKILSLFS
jgi:HAD superfamily hydrolase (TIGR01509 family)